MRLPLEKTMILAREIGMTIDIVERRLPIPGRHVTVDFLDCIDAIAIHGRKIIGIQATSRTNHSSHVKKILCDPTTAAARNVRDWLNAEAGYEIWAWDRHTPKGMKAIRWRVKITQFFVEKDKIYTFGSHEPDLTRRNHNDFNLYPEGRPV